jgi:hypothetical protein
VKTAIATIPECEWKNLDTSNNSPIWIISDSIGVDESEMIPCEISRGFSMSMIARSG